MPIRCCKDCIPPTRYPGCHTKCDKYLEEKAKLEEEKKAIYKNQYPKIYPSDFDMLACLHRPRKRRDRN